MFCFVRPIKQANNENDREWLLITCVWVLETNTGATVRATRPFASSNLWLMCVNLVESRISPISKFTSSIGFGSSY